jgi:nucleoside-diphosphate-sugar epimerase
MKVCVFGGSGFIGSRVVRSLVSGGHDVSALARTEEKAAFLKSLRASPVIGDLDRPSTVREAIGNSDVVVSLATPSFVGRLGKKRLRSLAEGKLNHTRNIVDAVIEKGNTPIVLSEGTLVFGDCGDRWVDESIPYNPVGFARIGQPAYLYAQRAAEEKGLALIRMLPGGVYGAGSWFADMLLPMMRKGWFRAIGDGQNMVSYVHVNDVADAYRLAVEKLPAGESFALVDDEPCLSLDFLNFVAIQLGRAPVKSIPKWVAGVFAGHVVAESLTVSCRVKNEKAKDLLGWRLTHRLIL